MQLGLQVVDVPQTLLTVEPGEVGGSLLQRVHGLLQHICSTKGISGGHLEMGTGGCGLGTWTAGCVWAEARRCQLAACHQHQSSAFVHDATVSQNRLDGFLQDGQRLIRNPQHQLQGGAETPSIANHVKDLKANRLELL